MYNKVIKDMGTLFHFPILGALYNYFCSVVQKYRCQLQCVWQSCGLDTSFCSYRFDGMGRFCIKTKK